MNWPQKPYDSWPNYWKRIYALTQAYWKFFDYGDRGFLLKTPLFAFCWANGLGAVNVDAREWGWRLLLWPASWGFILPLGGEMYRRTYERIEREFTKDRYENI